MQGMFVKYNVYFEEFYERGCGAYRNQKNIHMKSEIFTETISSCHLYSRTQWQKVFKGFVLQILQDFL